MFPFKDDNPTYRTPFVTITLIVICILVFLSQLFTGEQRGQEIIYQYGFIPSLLTGASSLPPHLEGFPSFLTTITSMFMHGGWFHLLGNMLFLWIFGDNVEDVLGHVRFVIFYFLCGLGAILLHFLSDPTSTIPMVGASGAIAGVLGAYLILFPRAKILTLVWLGFFLTTVRIRALWFLGAWFLLQWINALANSAESGVAWWAHIGGFIVGVFLLFILKPSRYLFGRNQGPWS